MSWFALKAAAVVLVVWFALTTVATSFVADVLEPVDGSTTTTEVEA